MTDYGNFFTDFRQLGYLLQYGMSSSLSACFCKYLCMHYLESGKAYHTCLIIKNFDYASTNRNFSMTLFHIIAFDVYGIFYKLSFSGLIY